MQLKSLLPAALAWSATAMLLPPDTSGDALQALSVGPAGGPITVRVPCSGCPVALDYDKEKGERAFDESGKSTDLLFDLVNKDNKILLNGNREIYPRVVASGPAWTVKQVKHNEDDDFAVTNDDVPVGISIETKSKHSKDGLRVSNVELRILGLEDKVAHVGTVVFQVLEHDGENTMIVTAPKVVPTFASLADASCTTTLCRVKTQMYAKLAALKATMGKFKSGCAKMMGMRPHHGGPGRHGNHPHPQRPHHHQQEGGEHNVVDRLKGGPAKFVGKLGGKKPCPGRKGMHGHHHHGKFMHKLAHGMAMFIHHILMPVLIGVAAGMAVSALGMVIGQLVFMIHMRLRGRRNGDYVAVYHVIEDSEEAGVDEEALPVYEAGEHVLPPAYTDEKVESEK